MSGLRAAESSFVASANAVFAQVAATLSRVPIARWRALAMVFIFIWLCRSLAQLVWVVFPPPSSPPAPIAPISPASSAAGGESIDIVALQETHLFGEYDPVLAAQQQEEKKPVIVDEEVNKITKLNLKLQGVINSSDPQKASAIIGETNNQKLYRIGEEISGVSGKVTLHRVEDLRVILDNNGEKEALWLYGEDGKKFATGTYTPPARSRPVRPPSDKKQVTVKKEDVFQVKSISDVVRFMVATEEGRMIGYKVRPGRKRELFDQVGLKNDDIVVSVNGIEVNEPAKVREVYQALKTATEANLEVLRDGSTQYIEIRLGD